jgi:hypothetical protein
MEVKKRYQFKCHCGGTEIEAVHTDAVVSSKILGIDKAGNIEYAKNNIEKCDHVCYQCSNCGVKIADDAEELLLKLEQEYYSVEQTFVKGIMQVVYENEGKSKEEIEEILAAFLKEKNIEIEK